MDFVRNRDGTAAALGHVDDAVLRRRPFPRHLAELGMRIYFGRGELWHAFFSFSLSLSLLLLPLLFFFRTPSALYLQERKKEGVERGFIARARERERELLERRRIGGRQDGTVEARTRG
jgi:hypothetical protein